MTSAHPSETTPHWPGSHAVLGVQLPPLTHTLPTHVRLPLQLPPQAMTLLQPSGILPQFLLCAAHVVGVQPQALASPPPPHDCGQHNGGVVPSLSKAKDNGKGDKPTKDKPCMN